MKQTKVNNDVVSVSPSTRKATGFTIPKAPWMTEEEWKERTDAVEARECRFVSE